MGTQRSIPTFRNSLSFRVLFTTLTISLVVLSVTGAALNSRLTGSIKKVKVESSIAEADSAIYAAQYQLYLAQGYTPTFARLQPSPFAIKKVVESYVKQAADSVDSFNAREVVLLKADASAFVDTNYGKASGGLDPDSLSREFRSRVRASQSIQSEFLTMKYVGGQKIPGFAAGRQIEIPGAKSITKGIVNGSQTEAKPTVLILIVPGNALEVIVTVGEVAEQPLLLVMVTE